MSTLESSTNAATYDPDAFAAARVATRFNRRRLAMYLILASILFHTAAYYVLDVNLTRTLQYNYLHWNCEDRTNASYLFEGIEFISMLIFAVISDAKLGRAKTILIGFSLYLLGYTLFTVVTNGGTSLCDTSKNVSGTSMGHEKCVESILPSLIITAIGSGVVRPNIIAFGADQIQEGQVSSRYFEKCIVVANLASIIYTFPVLLITSEEHYWFILHSVGLAMLCIAILLFLIGWRYYQHVKPYDSPVINIIPVLRNAFQTWRQSKHHTRSISREDTDADQILAEEEEIRRDQRVSSMLDYAKVIHHGKFSDRIVDDVKLFRNALIIFILILPNKLIYDQIFSTFEPQYEGMNYDRSDNATPAWLNRPIPVIITGYIESIAAIFGVFVLNVFVYTLLQRRNLSLTITASFVITMCFAIVTMCIAGGVEILRQGLCSGNNTASDLSIYAQIPQEIGGGLVLLFSLLAGYKFAYYVGPRSARSLFMSLLLISRGVASYIPSLYRYIPDLHWGKCSTWDFRCSTDSINKQLLYGHFFILAGLQFIFLLVFLICQRKIGMVRLDQQ